MNYNDTKNIKLALEGIPPVKSVSEIKIKNGLIEHLCIECESIGIIVIQQLDVKDSSALFDFYFRGLSAKSRNLFYPYPLFRPAPNSVEELSKKIADWKKDNDWSFLNLIKDGQIIGVVLLKAYNPEHPVSGIAVADKFHRKGLGFLLQTTVVEQARLLKLKKLYLLVEPDNIASVELHRKCGFKETGRLVTQFGYSGNEMVMEFNYG